MEDGSDHLPITGYLHVALMNGVSGIMVASEMHGRILQSGLYARTDLIKVAVVGDIAQIHPLCELLSPYRKYSVELFSQDLTLWEWPTLDMFKRDCEAGLEGHVWYLHTKGASQAGREKTPYNMHVYRNVAAWRGHMFDKVAGISRVPEGYVAAGSFLRQHHEVGRHFSGNFWWATTDYIRSLPVVPTEERELRVLSETWIGKASGELFNINTDWDESTDLYGFNGTTPLGYPVV